MLSEFELDLDGFRAYYLSHEAFVCRAVDPVGDFGEGEIIGY